jgi:hypothetical protein
LRRRSALPSATRLGRRLLAAGLSLLLFCRVATAHAAPLDADAGQAQPSASGKVEHHGFLWEARKGERHALLMGTMHVGVASDYPPDRSTRQRLASVDAIALEADISQADQSAAALMARAQLPEGEAGLDARLDAGLKSDIQRALQSLGVPAELAWRMKPWALGDTLVVLQAARLGFSPDHSTEAYLASLAASNGKPIVELEGIEAQFELLDSQPWPEQVDALRQAVGSILDGQAEQELRALVAAWRASDVSAMQEYLQRVRASPDPAERRQFERLITARNATMTDKIDRMLGDGRFYLVAVGSLHFFGADGLVPALKARGYTVTPLVPATD